MAASLKATGYGNLVGTANSKFRTIVQIYAEGNKKTGYTIYVRYYIQVTEGNFYGTVISNTWGSSVSVSGKGNYAVSDLIKKGTLNYGSKYSVSGSSQYTAGSGTTHKSSASVSWTAPRPNYTVKYNANGGSGAPSSQTKVYGQTLTLSKTIPKRTGYQFLGWATSRTATKATYLAGASYTANASVTLYAVWSIVKYSITYDAGANGGTLVVGGKSYEKYTTQVNYNANLGSGSYVPTKKNYNFVGWNDEQDGSGIFVENDTKVYENKYLYAIFEIAANCYIRNDGEYVPAMMYIKNNGVYEMGEVYVKDNEVYKGVNM